jgi:CBS domain-containing protein
MRARDLVMEFPTVLGTTEVAQAVQMLARLDLPGLIVVDLKNRPMVVLGSVDVLRMAVPKYCQDDPMLARVIDEAAADVFAQHIGDATMAQNLPEVTHRPPVVKEDATALEVASVMAQAAVPLLPVVDEHGAMVGAITLDSLLERVLLS